MSARSCIPRLRFALPAALLASLVFASGASADTVVVDTTGDRVTGCTIRDALLLLNQEADVGNCDPVSTGEMDTITFARSISGETITLDGGGPLVMNDHGGIEIVGPGMDQLTIDGNGLDRVFIVQDHEAVISGLTVTGGDPDPDAGDDLGDALGGGIYNLGLLTLSDVRVTGNTAEVSHPGGAFAAGGGIYNEGILRLNGSIVEANTATATSTDPTSSSESAIARGAGIASYVTSPWATLIISDSTIADNVATASSAGPAPHTAVATGGLDAHEGGSTTNFSYGIFQATNSTISGNTASATQTGTGTSSAIGGITTGGVGNALIEESTVAANRADGSGGLVSATGGILVEEDAHIDLESSTIAFNGPATGSADGANLNVWGDSEASLSNTIVSNPLGGGINCLGGDIESLGFNTIYPDDGPGCVATPQLGDRDDDPFPAPAGLADNGGPTETIALPPSSPAIDAGSSFGESTTDQRGLPLPVDFSAIPSPFGSDGTDIGAFEVQRACPNQESPQDAAVCGPEVGPTDPDPADPAGPTGERAAALKQCKKLKGKARAKKRKKCLARAARRPV